jgi:hypothetical protein
MGLSIRTQSRASDGAQTTWSSRRWRWITAILGGVVLAGSLAVIGPAPPAGAVVTPTSRPADAFHADAPGGGNDWNNAYLLSLLSDKVYEDGPSFESFAKNALGFDDAHFHSIPTTDTQFGIVNTDDALIIVFRGSTSITDWVLDIAGSPIAVIGIQAGFYSQASSAMPTIEAAVANAPGKKIWLAGHSLGGADALVAGWFLEDGVGPHSDVQGIVTFGAPKAFTGFEGAFIYNPAISPLTQRWVNTFDLVPTVPPLYDDTGSPSWIAGPPFAAGCSVSHSLPFGLPPYNFDDHDMKRYTNRIYANLPPTNKAEIVFPPPDAPEHPVSSCDFLDASPPSVVAHVTGALGDNGWYTGNVHVAWEYTDPESPILWTGGCGPVDVTSDTPGTTISCTARSDGGPTTGSVTIKRDTTPPIVVGSGDRLPDSNGWYNHAVTIDFFGRDTLSGAAVGSCTSVPYSGPDNSAATVSGTCKDNAGNVGTREFTLHYDATAPTAVTGAADRVPDSNGWYNHAVRVSFSGTDPTSGIDSCTSSSYSGPDATSVSVSGTCEDIAGNVSGAETFGFAYDATAPSITIDTPPAVTADYFRDQDVRGDYSCTDALSGLASCTGTVNAGAALDTSSFGPHDFTVKATDVAGNAASVTHGYTITYAFGGFAAPVVPLPGINEIKAGGTLPMRWTLLDAAGTSVPDRAPLFIVGWSSRFSCSSQGTTDITSTDSAGDTTVRWDTSTGQYVFNAASQKADAGFCRYFIIRAAGAQKVRVLVRFR